MNTVLLIFQILLSVILVGVVLIQSRGTGFARGFGSSQPSFTRRGLEKIVFRATFVLTVLFLIVSILSVSI